MLGEKSVSAMIPVSDPAKAREFYEGALGQKVAREVSDGTTEWEAGFYTYPTAENAGKSPATVAGWEVEDIEAAVRDLREKGVGFEEYDMPGLKTEDGIADIPGERAAWFMDPDGNILNVFERA